MLGGVSELAERFRYFSLDQYGVMHDGRTAYPGAADCLARLSASGCRAVILSNYAGRASTQRARLRGIGLDPDCLAGVVTSGELVHRHLAERHAELGHRVLWIAWADRENRGLGDFFDGLDDYIMVDSVEDADFILVSGVESIFASTSQEVRTDFERSGDVGPFVPTFKRAAARGLPLLCANPDLRVKRPGGWTGYLGGMLAQYYEEMGGRAAYLGKPHAPSFEEARRLLGWPEAEQVCHVGDSLHHDVAGATAAGLATAFVVSPGIHAEALPPEPTAAEVRALCAGEGVPVPWAVVPRFAW